MIYTKTSPQRHRIISDQQRTVKSPVRVIRVSTSPNRFYHTSNQKIQRQNTSSHQYQPYHYQPKVQQSSTKLKYFAQSPPKPMVSQTVYVLSPPKPTITSFSHVPIVLSQSKPKTLRQRLWAKNKEEPVEQYNIWQGYQSETSIPEALSPRQLKSSQILGSNSSLNFRKKSIISKLSPQPQSFKQTQFKRILKPQHVHFQRKPLLKFK